MTVARSRRWPRVAALASFVILVAAVAAHGASHPPAPNARRLVTAAEYAPYDRAGTGEISGIGSASPEPATRASIASRTVLLRPATSWASYWWNEYVLCNRTPTRTDPLAARHAREVVADSSGRFRFAGLPAGSYDVQSSVLWVHAGANGWDGPVTYVLLGKRVDLGPGEHAAVTLDSLRAGATLGPAAGINRPSAPESLQMWWDALPTDTPTNH